MGLKEARGALAERAARRRDAAKDIGGGSGREESCGVNKVVVVVN